MRSQTCTQSYKQVRRAEQEKRSSPANIHPNSFHGSMGDILEVQGIWEMSSDSLGELAVLGSFLSMFLSSLPCQALSSAFVVSFSVCFPKCIPSYGFISSQIFIFLSLSQAHWLPRLGLPRQTLQRRRAPSSSLQVLFQNDI